MPRAIPSAGETDAAAPRHRSGASPPCRRPPTTSDREWPNSPAEWQTIGMSAGLHRQSSFDIACPVYRSIWVDIPTDILRHTINPLNVIRTSWTRLGMATVVPRHAHTHQTCPAFGLLYGRSPRRHQWMRAGMQHIASSIRSSWREWACSNGRTSQDG